MHVLAPHTVVASHFDDKGLAGLTLIELVTCLGLELIGTMCKFAFIAISAGLV